MRTHHKIGLLIAVIVLLLLALLLPRRGHADPSAAFGDVVVRYSALSTEQLDAGVARRYGIERGAHNGLVNVAVERKSGAGASEMIAADVTGTVADLTGHKRPIRFRETRDEGGIDYLGEFALDTSGTYVFTIEVTPDTKPAAPDSSRPAAAASDGQERLGRARPYTVTFNRDFVLD